MQTFSVSYPVFLCHLADHTEDDNKVETGLEELKRMMCFDKCSVMEKGVSSLSPKYHNLYEAAGSIRKTFE